MLIRRRPDDSRRRIGAVFVVASRIGSLMIAVSSDWIGCVGSLKELETIGGNGRGCCACCVDDEDASCVGGLFFLESRMACDVFSVAFSFPISL